MRQKSNPLRPRSVHPTATSSLANGLDELLIYDVMLHPGLWIQDAGPKKLDPGPVSRTLNPGSRTQDTEFFVSAQNFRHTVAQTQLASIPFHTVWHDTSLYAGNVQKLVWLKHS